MFKRFCQSVLDTAANPENIEFVVYKGTDDNSPYEYLGNHKIIVSKNLGFDGGIDRCQQAAAGPIYGFFPDDIVFESQGWDKMVEEAFNGSPDKIIFVYPNDNIFHKKYGAVGFLHKNWIDTVGHFLVPALVRRGDVWLNRVARALGRQYFLQNMRIKNFDIRDDETHQDYLKVIADNNTLEKYRSPEMTQARREDARKLRQFIANFK